MAVTIRRLTKEYIDSHTGKRVQALEDLSLHVETGHFVCIVGPSGCGKTTFLHIVAGLRARTVGDILVDGQPTKGPGPDRGMVFQSYALFAWKTVYQNIEFGLRMKGTHPAERFRIVEHYINLMGLNGFEHHYPRQLSGGMQQRVAVARALANKPKVLLMDEPFASVDALTRLTLQEELTRVWAQEKTTVIFVTHSIDEAVFLGDRVVILTKRPGKLKGIVDVAIPRPRVWSVLEQDPQFNALRQKVLRSVQAEVEEALSPAVSLEKRAHTL